MTDGPGDPMTVAAEAAVQLHELFVSLISAGFTETQALTLIAAMFRSSQ